jgi:hypothetical protein
VKIKVLTRENLPDRICPLRASINFVGNISTTTQAELPWVFLLLVDMDEIIWQPHNILS